ncbi:uncharacterized protein LOC130802457 [Amaranthus tricolor]|uniref:uncharacterized protein LOC130802457 n=1 Tax=Amaranthus tricolor TaxID=29722 RepID=UPI00258A2CF4|nr:uncharacterized protein LOC130802457 [Amaranthus tricolor]
MNVIPRGVGNYTDFHGITAISKVVSFLYRISIFSPIFLPILLLSLLTSCCTSKIPSAILTMASSSSFHHALTVTNIKNQVPLTLDMETVQYSSWVKLFRLTCIVYNVLDHIDSTAPRSSDIDTALWMRLDAVLKQWLYATISPDFLQTILKPNATAHEVWTRVEELFHDNKNTRAVFLETQFNKLALSDFPNA